MKGKKWENVNVKILSLLMAVLLEVYFYSPDNSVTAPISATLEVEGVPQDMILMKPENGGHGIPVRIDVHGPRPLIDQIRGSSHRFTVKYPIDRPMSFRPILDLKQLWLPGGVEIIGVTPNDLILEFEKIISRELPVAVEDTGRPKTGFVVAMIKSDPPTVRVSGPEREMQSLVEIRGEKVNVTDLSESQEFEQRLLPGNPALQLSPERVKVQVEIVPVAGQASFEPVNVKLLAPRGFAGTVEPSRVKVVLAGPPAVLSSLSLARLELKADARSLDEGRFQLRLKGELPQGVSILSTEPELVSVQLIKQQGS